MLASVLTSICFLLSHPNPTSHCTAYIKAYEELGIACKVYTTELKMHEKLTASGIHAELVKLAEQVDVVKLAGRVNEHALCIADISGDQWSKVYDSLESMNSKTIRATYYDNPETFVTKEYSSTAESMLNRSQMGIFANVRHVDTGVLNHRGEAVDLSGKILIGTGLYPMNIAEEMKVACKSAASVLEVRKKLLGDTLSHAMRYEITTFAGGANEEYFVAFNHFLDLVEQTLQESDAPLSNKVFVLKQHPRAMKKGPDAALLKARIETFYALDDSFHFIVCPPEISTGKMLGISDRIIYHQTSMAPQFLFGGVDKIIQTDIKTREDHMTAVGFPSVTTKEQFITCLSAPSPYDVEKKLTERLGITKDWKANLPTTFPSEEE